MKKINSFSRKERRKRRVISRFLVQKEKPQLRVFRSNKRIYAQVIDYQKNITLCSANDFQIEKKERLTKKEKARLVGLNLGEKLKKLNITQVIFNRGYYPYAGRIKALVEGIKESGIKI